MKRRRQRQVRAFVMHAADMWYDDRGVGRYHTRRDDDVLALLFYSCEFVL